MAIVTGRLIPRSRASGEVLDPPMARIVRAHGDRIVAVRPFDRDMPICGDGIGSAP